MSVLVAVLFTLLVVVLALFTAVKRLLWVATPNQALIFSGTTRTVSGRSVGFRFVRGGRSLRRPLIERVDVLDLSMFTVLVHVTGAFSKGGIPLTIEGVANVKLPSGEPLLSNAVERFLGRSHQEILHIAKETLEGNLRGVLASLTPEEVNEDKLRFAQTLLEGAEHDMSRIGLVLDTLKIQNVTDEVNYLSSIGRIRGARANQEQAIAEAEARAEAAVQHAENWCKSEIARLEADLNIARRETEKRVADAKSRREALILEARGQVAAEVALLKAEIEKQRTRAVLERRRLDADIVQPALAAQRAAEEHARGEAARILERGRGEAASLAKVAEAYRKGGSGARDVLALQSLLPVLASIAGADAGLSIEKLSILPGGPARSGADLARTIIGLTEQVRAGTGVDLASAAKKLTASE